MKIKTVRFQHFKEKNPPLIKKQPIQKRTQKNGGGGGDSRDKQINAAEKWCHFILHRVKFKWAETWISFAHYPLIFFLNPFFHSTRF